MGLIVKNGVSYSGGGGDTDSQYILPPATTNTLGGVKPDGTTVTVDEDGTIHSSGGGSIDTSDLLHKDGSIAADYLSIGTIKDGTTPGQKSLTVGIEDSATGEAATATGYQTVASGYASHAEGAATEASNLASHAENMGAVASGAYAHAEGNITYAVGGASHTEGTCTRATGLYSHAEGYLTYASGQSSHAEGQMLYMTGTNYVGTATGVNGGDEWTLSENVYSNISSYANYRAGLVLKLTGGSIVYYPVRDLLGDNKVRLGVIATDSDQEVGAEISLDCYNAKSTIATKAGAHAEGVSTSATGTYAHAEGNQTTASGSQAHAEGQSCTASGVAAHAEGYGSRATANYAHASGKYTTAGYEAQTTVGKYNSNKDTSLFEVGNGTSTTVRSNAMEVDRSGNLNITGAYQLNGSALITASTTDISVDSTLTTGTLYFVYEA